MGGLPTNKKTLAELINSATENLKQSGSLEAMLAAQNPIYTADPTQTVDAARSFSQGMSSGALGAIPGSGLVNAMGIQPRYDENWFIPKGITQGPNIRENLQGGNYLDAGLQGLGILGDAAAVAGAATMVPKSQQRGMVNAEVKQSVDKLDSLMERLGYKKTREQASNLSDSKYFSYTGSPIDASKKGRAEFFKTTPSPNNPFGTDTLSIRVADHNAIGGRGSSHLFWDRRVSDEKNSERIKSYIEKLNQISIKYPKGNP